MYYASHTNDYQSHDNDHHDLDHDAHVGDARCTVLIIAAVVQVMTIVLVIAPSEIVMIHINKKLLTLNGDIDPLKLNLVARMGGNYYLNVKSENLFEIQKPIGVNAIGVDKLPNHANKSDILTKNDLARLANIETLPKKAQIKKFIESSEIEKITSLAKENEKVILNHKKVKEYLDKNDLESAVLTLFSI